jgi:hypothetical protein
MSEPVETSVAEGMLARRQGQQQEARTAETITTAGNRGLLMAARTLATAGSTPTAEEIAVFRIHDILLWIRIRRFMPLTNGSGSWIRILQFSSLTFKMPKKKLIFLTQFFLLVTF